MKSLSKIFLPVGALAVLYFFVACSSSTNNGGNNNPGTPPPLTCTGGYDQYGNCISYNNGAQVANYSNMPSSSYFQDAQFALNINATSANYYGYSNGYQVSLSGTLNLTQGNLSFCGAYPGAYSVTTTQIGYLSGTVLGQITLQATGPNGIVIQMYVGSGVLQSNNRLNLNMNIYINGAYCGYLVTL